jgi:hypothetical protein
MLAAFRLDALGVIKRRFESSRPHDRRERKPFVRELRISGVLALIDHGNASRA